MRPGVEFHSELADLSAQAEENVRRVEKLCSALSRAQFNWRPATGVWSIAECVSHLNVVNGLDVAVLEGAVTDARQRGVTGTGPFRYGWLVRKWVASVEPPPKHKLRAPKTYVPPTEADPAETVEEYRRTNRRLQELMHAAEGLHLVRVKVPIPILKGLRMPLGARFALINAHDRRHLWQAEQVAGHAEFPR